MDNNQEKEPTDFSKVWFNESGEPPSKKRVFIKSQNNKKKSLQKEKSLANQISENVFGFAIQKEDMYRPAFFVIHNFRTRKPIPSGFVVKHTKKGHSFLERIKSEVQFDVLPEKPHMTPCSPLREIKEQFGQGIFLYFDFARYLVAVNIFLFVLCIINTAVHLYFDGIDTSKENQIYRNFYVSRYSSSSKLVWKATSIIAIFLSFVFGPLYGVKIQRYFQKTGDEDTEGEFEVSETIPENQEYTNHSRIIRYIISSLIALLLLAVSIAVTFALVLIRENTSQNYVVSIGIAFLIKLFNVIWEKVCMFLAAFEKHKTWASFRNHHTIKFYVFKMLNVLLVYLLQYFISKLRMKGFLFFSFFMIYSELTFDIPFLNFGANSSSYACEIDSAADQVFAIIALDATIGHVWEVLFPYCLWRFKAKEMDEEEARPEFDIADEYLNLFYRQFIIQLGLPIFPMITFIGMLSSLIGTTTGKFRLAKIYKQPVMMDGSMKKFIIFFMFTTALFSTASYPYGTGWVLFGGLANCEFQKTEK